MIKLEVGRIYLGKITNKPVKYLGLRLDERKAAYQFEYVLPEHKPREGMSGVIGYGQNLVHIEKEEYKLMEELDLIYGGS